MNFSPKSSFLDVIILQLLIFVILSTNPIQCSSIRKQTVFEHNPREADGEHWRNLAQATLRSTLDIQLNDNVAKNIIFFLGDGMGVTTVTAGRIFTAQQRGESGEESYLEFDRFPNVAMIKTYNVNKQVPDSAGTATAYLCGVKANYKTVGVDARTILEDCDSSIGAEVFSILAWAQDAGKETGFVTTTRVTHASPSALYAHVPLRYWESDSKLPAGVTRCKDIARQLIEDKPGRDIKVIMGGGRRNFIPKEQIDLQEQKPGNRSDGKDLIEEWKSDKRSRKASYRYMPGKDAFDEWDPDEEEFVMGLFNYSHMSYTSNRGNTSIDSEPSIAEMTEKAIRRLQRSQAGFFLFVEGGRIDQAHHAGLIRHSLEELEAMNAAVKIATQLTDEKDTLIIVTADHSHPMTINGYPERGNTVLGLAGFSHVDKMPYTTLMYTNGVGYKHKVNGKRANLSFVDTEAKTFTPQVAVPMEYDTHGGEDVALYARGPMSHLFRGVKEQNYIPHALAYAACIGSNLEHCASKQTATIASSPEPTFRPRPFPKNKSRRGGATNMAPSVLLATFLSLCKLASLINNFKRS